MFMCIAVAYLYRGCSTRSIFYLSVIISYVLPLPRDVCGWMASWATLIQMSPHDVVTDIYKYINLH